MGCEVTRPYKQTVRSDYNESYRSGRVTKKKNRKRDTLIKKPTKVCPAKQQVGERKPPVSLHSAISVVNQLIKNL